MEIHGREVIFKKTVGAVCNLEPLFDAAGGDIKEYMTGSFSNQQQHAAVIMSELSKGAEEAAFWEAYHRGEDYQIRPLSVEEALTLDNDVFNSLFIEAMMVWNAGVPTVKAEEGKKTSEGTGSD